MNINNFEKYVNEIILDRGYNYYTYGNVLEKYEKENNEYIFIVAGSQIYEVIVQLDENGEILSSYCNCPYDFGPICKHQVAAYFEIRNHLKSQPNNEKVKDEVMKQPEIEDVLNSLSKEELINIILDIVKRDETIKDNIVFRYSDNSKLNLPGQCKKIINSIVRKYTRNEGFILYREAYGFASEMKDLLEQIGEIYQANDNPVSILDATLIVLEESIKALGYADDSDGYIGSLISEIFEYIQEIAYDSKKLDTNLRRKMFKKILNQADKEIFHDWDDYYIDIINICSEFADIEELRNDLRRKIEYFVNENINDRYSEYSIERMLLILYNIIREYGPKEEAEKFIKKNMKFTSFRELVINKFMKEKDYSKVIELALEGERKDKKYKGLVVKWKK
ncbi:SWIM zinc finger family protein [Thermohalobacter berrensis]|uniref:SWIM zinc finger family protein n=1 Tax=Thermohalobacter berrensis TaxID=99594 RepID=UPI001FAB1781|nr:SWIM zinc finger family protein [Thermohalobacter berrensis]